MGFVLLDRGSVSPDTDPDRPRHNLYGKRTFIFGGRRHTCINYLLQ